MVLRYRPRRRHLMEIQPGRTPAVLLMLKFNRRPRLPALHRLRDDHVARFGTAHGQPADPAFVPPASYARCRDDEGVVVATAVPGEGVTGRGSGPSRFNGRGQAIRCRQLTAGSGWGLFARIASPTPVGTIRQTSALLVATLFQPADEISSLPSQEPQSGS